MLNRPSTIVCTGEGLFIWPGILIASLGTRRSEHEIGDMLASLHGPDILRTRVPSATSLAADLVRCGRPEPARRLVVGLPRLPLSPSGKVLVRAIASRLGVSAPALPESEGEGGAATLSHELAKKIAASLDGTFRTALRLEATFCALTPGALSKGNWDADKHPRAGEGPNPGWFAPVDHATAAASADHNHDSNSDIAEVTPVADFSGGFHDAVVDAWIATFNGAGTPAIKAPAIRMIGTGAVVGFPDILIKAPGVPAEAIEVKTGEFPTFTPSQAFYIPLLQLGGHIYSTDPRIAQLGLMPGVPFPPMAVYVIYTKGPGLPYGAQKIPGPNFSKGVIPTAPRGWCAT